MNCVFRLRTVITDKKPKRNDRLIIEALTIEKATELIQDANDLARAGADRGFVADRRALWKQIGGDLKAQDAQRTAAFDLGSGEKSSLAHGQARSGEKLFGGPDDSHVVGMAPFKLNALLGIGHGGNRGRERQFLFKRFNLSEGDWTPFLHLFPCFTGMR